jgi:hypothetical protein
MPTSLILLVALSAALALVSLGGGLTVLLAIARNA